MSKAAQKKNDKPEEKEHESDEDLGEEEYLNNRHGSIIQSLLQRIEANGQLEPVNNYGRHQGKNVKRKKKKKDESANPQANANTEKDKAFDEDFYDLDDDFIDDGDVDYIEDMQKGGQLDHSPFSEMDEEDAISGAEDQEVKHLLKDFRVLGVAELEQMQREEEARMNKLKEKLGQAPVSGGNKTPKKSGSDGETTDATGTTNRKRKRGQMTEEESSCMQAVFVEMTQIQMTTGDAAMTKFDKQIEKLVKILLDHDPAKNPANQKTYDHSMEIMSARLGDFFHKT